MDSNYLFNMVCLIVSIVFAMLCQNQLRLYSAVVFYFMPKYDDLQHMALITGIFLVAILFSKGLS